MKRICHLTSVHPRYDVRIFHKECLSLAEAGFEVYLIVADGKGNELINNVHIIDVGEREISISKRILLTTNKILDSAIMTKAEIFHLHDPELLKIAKNLLKLGSKVIYDSHENMPQTVLSKQYLPPLARRSMSTIARLVENSVVSKLNGVIGATSTIRDRFLSVNKNTININNYPKISERESDIDWFSRTNSICYIGGITKIRGAMELIESLSGIDVILHLAGKYQPFSIREILTAHAEWKKVKEYGFVDRASVNNIYKVSKVGMVTLHPIINYLNSLPVKMFEYMNAGLPVICSNFPLWEQIVVVNKCGVSVNPLHPQQIGEAIKLLLKNDNLAYELGQKGKELIDDKFNWNKESAKLIQFYAQI